MFGMDAGASPLLVTNVTSNGYAMAADTAAYVANRINGKGNVVMFVYDAFPPVHSRDIIADAIFKNYPDIKVLDRVTPDVKDGGIADSRAKMEAILAANPAKGASPPSGRRGTSLRSARCRRSRRPAAATKASSSPASTPTRRRARRSPRAAISRPRWRRISRASAAPPPTAVKRYLAGEKIKQSVIYVPTKLITSANREGMIGARCAVRRRVA